MNLFWETTDCKKGGATASMQNLGKLKSPNKEFSSIHGVLPCCVSCTCPCTHLHSLVALNSCMAHSYANLTHNKLQLETSTKMTRCCTGLNLNMEQKFWAVALNLALLKTRLGFFHDRQKQDLKGEPP